MKSIDDGFIGLSGWFAALVCAVLTSGCASVAETRGTASAAAAQDAQTLSRAERVFLYQSRIADALLDRYPLLELFEDADPVLLRAEARMTESCAHLTQAVLTHFEGSEPSLGLRLRVMTSIGACERAARRIERLLSGSPRADTI